MRLPRRQVVHIRLEVLHDPRLVCTRQIRAGVRERDRADGGVVCLQDRLEVEGESIPEGELS